MVEIIAFLYPTRTSRLLIKDTSALGCTAGYYRVFKGAASIVRPNDQIINLHHTLGIPRSGPPIDTHMSEVLVMIRELLSQHRVAYKEINHEPTHTSAESARVRGESLSIGAKALLLKTDDTFRLFVLPADMQLDAKKVKQELKTRSIRFATPEELFDLTGLVPGSLPPFGNPVLPFELYGDTAIGALEDKVAFNAGSLTSSIVMKASDWKSVARPAEFSFAKQPPAAT